MVENIGWREISVEEHKQHALRILVEVADFCEKNDIRYFLAYGTIKTDEAGTLDFSGVPAFFVTTVLIVQCSAAYNVHRIEPYLISSTVAFSSSKVL